VQSILLKTNSRKSAPEWRTQGTIVLAREFVARTQRFEKIVRAKWWNHPLLCRGKKEKLQELREDINEISGELGVRYKGIMTQLFQRMEGGGDFDIAVSNAWDSVRTTALMLKDYKRFSPILWDAFVPSREPETHSLKPKFILRQFVDEIPSCKEQGIMISTAYGPQVFPPVTGSELLICLEYAYGLLHVELIRYSPDLHVMTNEAISPETIASITPPYAQYEHWLFNC